MGNTPVMIFRHYRELVLPQDATAWWNIFPEQATNVVPMGGYTKTLRSFLRILRRTVWWMGFSHNDFKNHWLTLSSQRSCAVRRPGNEQQLHSLHDRFEAP